MLKALQPEVPWSSYRSMLDVSHKDHATAMAVAKLVQMLVTGVRVLLQDCTIYCLRLSVSDTVSLLVMEQSAWPGSGSAFQQRIDSTSTQSQNSMALSTTHTTEQHVEVVTLWGCYMPSLLFGPYRVWQLVDTPAETSLLHPCLCSACSVSPWQRKQQQQVCCRL